MAVKRKMPKFTRRNWDRFLRLGKKAKKKESGEGQKEDIARQGKK